MNYIKLGEEVLQKFIDDLSDISIPEKKPLLEGKNMFIILAKKLISNIYKAKFKGGINYAKTKNKQSS